MTKVVEISAVLMTVLLASCRGGGSSPGAPSPVLRNAVVQATVTAAGAAFKQVGSTATSLQFELTGSVNFRETGGLAATIQQVSGTITFAPSGQTASGSLAVAVSVAANGSASASYTQTFELPLDATGATWRFSATGVDANGRSVVVPAVESAIAFPEPAPPAASSGSADRILVFGGGDYSVYLGCFSCSRFDSESIWNEFGSYGSPFSLTSINNQFSQYGSPFASTSACNELASTPPVIVDSHTFYGEFTLNHSGPRPSRPPP